MPGLSTERAAAAAAPVDRTERIIERDAHHRVVETSWTVLDKKGRPVVRRGRYTVLQNGMHYLQDGLWVESREVICRVR